MRRPAGRRPGLDRVRLGAPDRGADLGHHPAPPGRHRRPRPRAGRRDGRRQPLRLRRRRPPLLRRPHARPPQAGLRGGTARGAAGPDHRRRRPDPGALHQLPGHAGRGRRAPEDAGHARPGPGRPAQARAHPGLRRRRGHQPVRHPQLLAGRRRTRPVTVPGDRRQAAVPPPRRAAAPGPPGAGPGRGLRHRRPAPGRHPPGAGRRAASSAPPPTAVSSPSSTPAWPTPPTAGRSSTPCRP